MTTKKIYGPWIKWHGGKCPVPPDTLVGVKFRGGSIAVDDVADLYYWHQHGDSCDIMEYCVAIGQADLEAAEKLLRANGYTVTKPLTFEDVVPLTEAPPEDTEIWIVSAGTDEGVYRALFQGMEVGHRAIKRRMAYLNKEHALIAARHIFGLKGGEL